MHPGIEHACAEAEEAYERAQQVITLAAAVLPLWPRLPRFARRATEPRLTSSTRLVVTHAFEPPRRGWQRCSVCWRCVSVKAWLDGAVNECHGVPSILRTIGDGHKVVSLPCDASTTLVVCLLCGAWATNRPVKLSRRCEGVPTVGGLNALKRIARGKHPGPRIRVNITGAADFVAGWL